ncbi:ABC-2 transporter permease [Clostridium sp. MB40-C1]|uniref:ABC-2 transporter permease n=1 Tax=Clostridium sp. MB40-C1 TaxID=3070996 RepID=UPI0027DFC3E8|nr:ABC-2 transporter permease [Clostridium sp. MB40-C1]WMJ81103.1 ABC-2 transporter permease [Clostridium sp. MB40-C1]
MLNLIIKDFKITKKINVIFFIYALGMAFVAIKSQAKHPGTLYIMSLILIVYISLLYANGYDGKYKIHIALNSMPVKKKNIVFSKYLSMIVYLAFYFLVMFIGSNVFGIIFNNTDNVISIWDFVICFNAMTIFYALYYPLYYKVNKDKLAMLNFGIYITVLIIPTLFTKFMKSSLGHTFLMSVSRVNNINTIHLIFLLVAIVLQIISVEISFRIYSRKEFY